MNLKDDWFSKEKENYLYDITCPICKKNFYISQKGVDIKEHLDYTIEQVHIQNSYDSFFKIIQDNIILDLEIIDNAECIPPEKFGVDNGGVSEAVNKVVNEVVNKVVNEVINEVANKVAHKPPTGKL